MDARSGDTTVGQYEFTPEEDRVIGSTGARSRWWGILLVAFTVLFAALGLMISSLAGFDGRGLLIWAVICVLPAYIGLQFLQAGRSLNAVVTTEGNDVAHLLEAIRRLGAALLVQVVAMSAWLLLLVFAFGSVITATDRTRDRALLSAMRSDLRNLAARQEIHYANSGSEGDAYSYSASLEGLNFTPSEGVTLTLGSADAGGWSAHTEHADLPGVGCAVYIGTVPPPTTAGGTTPSSSGEVVCDPT